MGPATSRTVAGRDLGCDSNWNARLQGAGKHRARIPRANGLLKNCLARFGAPAPVTIKKGGGCGPPAGRPGQGKTITDLIARTRDVSKAETDMDRFDAGRRSEHPIDEVRSGRAPDLIAAVRCNDAGGSNKHSKSGEAATNFVPGCESWGRS